MIIGILKTDKTSKFLTWGFGTKDVKTVFHILESLDVTLHIDTSQHLLLYATASCTVMNTELYERFSEFLNGIILNLLKIN